MTSSAWPAAPTPVRPADAIALHRFGARVLVIVAVAVLSLLVPAAGASAHAPHAPTREDTAGILLAHINAERVVAGLQPLRLDQQLAVEAMTWSARMALTGQLGHATLQLPLGVTATRENVGYSGNQLAGRRLHTMFMASPPHREAILDPRMTTFGVGVVEFAGRTWATQRFTDAPVP